MDDFFDVVGFGFDGAGAGHVADGAEADCFFFVVFVFFEFEIGGFWQEHGAAFENFATVRKINVGDVDFFDFEVLPDVDLCPITQGKDAEVFAHLFFAVEDVPEFGTLVFGVPLAEFVAVREEAFFGAGFFFVATGASDGGVELRFGNGVEEGDGLEGVATGVWAFFFDGFSGVDGVLDFSDEEGEFEFFGELIAEAEDFGEIMPRIDMQNGKRNARGIKCFLREMDECDGIFSAGEHEDGTLELRDGFAQDEDGFVFQLLEMIKSVVFHEFLEG